MNLRTVSLPNAEWSVVVHLVFQSIAKSIRSRNLNAVNFGPYKYLCSMQIRKATLSDIPAIMAIIKKIVPLMQADGNFQWNDTYPNNEVFEKDVEAGELWVADIDGAIGGITAITTDQYPGYADAGLDLTQAAIVPHRVAVDPGFRGMGIAKALMLEAEAEAKRRGIDRLRVDTNSQNKATQSLFPKLGYSFCGEIGLEFRPGLKFLCYEKVIA